MALTLQNLLRSIRSQHAQWLIFFFSMWRCLCVLLRARSAARVHLRAYLCCVR